MLYSEGLLPITFNFPTELELEPSESIGDIIIVCDLSILLGGALGPPGTEGGPAVTVAGG